jgi:excisionase family DNA binding protein
MIDPLTAREYNCAIKEGKEIDVSDELLTIEQVASELQLHPDTIRRYIREGKLKGVRISSTVVRVKRSELDKFIQDRSTDQPEKS